ncbi:MAG: AmmeMemoRadiSam system protein A [Coriobacteriia bacterium]|nr:AmmeMemoRadiSam system protein A [Coriobacteriia bacterium]
MGILAAYAVPHPPLIIPAVGRGMERGIPATVRSYEAVAAQVAQLRPETIVVTSPHAPLFRDGFYISGAARVHGSMADFRAPREQMEVTYDQELSERLRSLANNASIPTTRAGYDDNQLDHATFIPLWFVNNAYAAAGLSPDYQVVRVGLSGLDFATHRALGQALAQAIGETGRRVVFIASGDLSHRLKPEEPYGFVPEGPAFDSEICRIFEEGSLEGLFQFERQLVEAAGECGLRSFQIMAGALGIGWTSQLLSHEDTYGVGYAVAVLSPPEAADTPAAEADAQPAPAAEPVVDPYVALARAALDHFVTTGEDLPQPANLPEDMTTRRAGAFVSLHKHGQLRGCIGTISATQPCLAAEIIRNARCAANEDPRFSPVRPEELRAISLSVDVLGEAEDIADESQLDPQRFGVIVTKGWRRGLLLPALEGVDTVEQQVAIARQKAGIAPGERVQLQRFEVVRHDRGGEAPEGRP